MSNIEQRSSDLVMALNDHKASVRDPAAELLKDLRDPRTIEPLIASMMMDETGSLRSPVVEALEAFGDPVVEPLISQVAKGNNLFRWRAVEILGNIGDRRAEELLDKLSLSDPDATVREAAGAAMTKIRQRAAIEPHLRLTLGGRV